jgi:hypothetical protein
MRACLSLWGSVQASGAQWSWFTSAWKAAQSVTGAGSTLLELAPVVSGADELDVGSDTNLAAASDPSGDVEELLIGDANSQASPSFLDAEEG